MICREEGYCFATNKARSAPYLRKGRRQSKRIFLPYYPMTSFGGRSQGSVKLMDVHGLFSVDIADLKMHICGLPSCIFDDRPACVHNPCHERPRCSRTSWSCSESPSTNDTEAAKCSPLGMPIPACIKTRTHEFVL